MCLIPEWIGSFVSFDISENWGEISLFLNTNRDPICLTTESQTSIRTAIRDLLGYSHTNKSWQTTDDLPNLFS